MSRKSKGINAERELVHLFRSKTWACIRVAGSGSSRYPCPDILAANVLRKLAIEAKTTKAHSKYFSKEEIEQLRIFAANFGAEPWLAVKFRGFDWHFVSLEDLRKSGKCYVVSIDLVKNKGLLFEELIK